MQIILYLSVSILFIFSFGLSIAASQFVITILALAEFVTAYKYPKVSFRALLFSILTVSFAANISCGLKALPSLLVFASAWIAGYSLRIIADGRKIVFPEKKWLFILVLAGIITSSLYSATKIIPFVPDWNLPIATLMSGKAILLKNAIGWVMLGFAQWSFGIVFFIALFNYKQSDAFFDKAIRFLIYGLTLSVAVAFVQHFISISFANTSYFAIEQERVSGGAFDPNAFAFSIFLCLPFLVEQILLSYKLQRYIFSLIFLAALIALMFTATRTAVIGSILFVAFASIFLVCYRRVKLTVAFIPVLLILSGVFFIATPVEKRFKAGSVKNILSERLPYWKTGVGIWKENLLMGTGAGRYLIVQPDYLRSSPAVPWNTNDTSGNYFIQIAAEMGVVGVILYTLLFLALIKIIITAFFRGYPSVIYAFTLMIMLVMLFSGPHLNIFEVSALFWLALLKIIPEDSLNYA